MSSAVSKGGLSGKRILVTRAAHQSAPFVRLLQQQGATPQVVPLLDIVAPASWQPLDDALLNLLQYQYIILTSVNGVNMVRQRLRHLGREDVLSSDTPQPLWVCVGPKTAQALEKLGRRGDLQPRQYRAEAVIEMLLERGVAGTRILYPKAQLARDLIPQQLRRAGAVVDDPVAYNTVPAPGGKERILELLRQRQLDVVTFTSSSSVDNFVAVLGDQVAQLTGSVVLASIGPLTTATATAHGLRVAVEAREYTLEGLVAALADYYHNA